MKETDIKRYPDRRGPYTELRYKLAGRIVRETVKNEEVEARVAEIVHYVENLTEPLVNGQAQEYRLAKSRLGDLDLLAAVDFFLKHHVEDARIRDCTADYLSWCEGRDRPRTLATKRSHLAAFETHVLLKESVLISEVTREDIVPLLDSFASPKTSNNIRVTLVGFFNWCRDEGRISSGKHVLETIRARKVPVSDPVPFEPGVVEKLLQTAVEHEDWQSVLVIALGAFAGIRQAEIQRLRWSDVHLDVATSHRASVSYVDLGSEITKTSQRRRAHILGKGVEWVKLVRHKVPAGQLGFSDFGGTSHLLIRRKNVNRALSKLADTIGENWIPNGLRKGFISHAAAKMRPNKIAQLTGHSVDTLETHYKGLVSDEAANHWFSIEP